MTEQDQKLLTLLGLQDDKTAHWILERLCEGSAGFRVGPAEVVLLRFILDKLSVYALPMGTLQDPRDEAAIQAMLARDIEIGKHRDELAKELAEWKKEAERQADMKAAAEVLVRAGDEAARELSQLRPENERALRLVDSLTRQLSEAKTHRDELAGKNVALREEVEALREEHRKALEEVRTRGLELTAALGMEKHYLAKCNEAEDRIKTLREMVRDIRQERSDEEKRLPELQAMVSKLSADQQTKAADMQRLKTALRAVCACLVAEQGEV